MNDNTENKSDTCMSYTGNEPVQREQNRTEFYYDLSTHSLSSYSNMEIFIVS